MARRLPATAARTPLARTATPPDARAALSGLRSPATGSRLYRVAEPGELPGLDATLGPHEEGLDAGHPVGQCFRDVPGRVEVARRSAAGEDDHHAITSSARSLRPSGASRATASKHTHGREHDHQVAAAKRDERKRQPGRGENAKPHADVKERLQADQRRHADRQQLPEEVLRTARDAKPDADEGQEAEDHRDAPRKPPLLADHREDEVVVGLRKETELLAPLPEADSRHSAGSDGDETLVALEDCACRRRARVQQERLPPRAAVSGLEDGHRERGRQQPEEDEVPDPRPRHEDLWTCRWRRSSRPSTGPAPARRGHRSAPTPQGREPVPGAGSSGAPACGPPAMPSRPRPPAWPGRRAEC